MYHGESAVATEEQYASQAQAIAQSTPAASAQANADNWMPLGVFALTADGEASGPPPSIFLQLAVSKQGEIAGTIHKSDVDQTEQVEGAVDMKSQRTAWAIAGKDWPIMETGLKNLTEDSSAALLHFADGQTQQWLLVRVEDPEHTAER